MSKPIKVLMLEDDPMDAALLLRQLKKSDLNLTVLHVDNGTAFEEQLDLFLPDLILSDFSLPSIDGPTAFAIKQKKCPDVPFIIVSGTIGEENAVELIKSGITDYALKDKIFTLIPKVKRALKDAEEQRTRKIGEDKFRAQYKTLLEIASLQSHQVRGPISNVLGLISLFNFDNPSDPVNSEVIRNLQSTTTRFDNIIREIVKKTGEIEDLKE
ncbi:MAG TPA: response regulator [Bacteroidia bacterium]|nr:response regulator [Bacteroidia bacterium]